jgi:hypothetical protein
VQKGRRQTTDRMPTPFAIYYRQKEFGSAEGLRIKFNDAACDESHRLLIK